MNLWTNQLPLKTTSLFPLMPGHHDFCSNKNTVDQLATDNYDRENRLLKEQLAAAGLANARDENIYCIRYCHVMLLPLKASPCERCIALLPESVGIEGHWVKLEEALRLFVKVLLMLPPLESARAVATWLKWQKSNLICLLECGTWKVHVVAVQDTRHHMEK